MTHIYWKKKTEKAFSSIGCVINDNFITGKGFKIVGKVLPKRKIRKGFKIPGKALE